MFTTLILEKISINLGLGENLILRESNEGKTPNKIIVGIYNRTLDFKIRHTNDSYHYYLFLENMTPKQQFKRGFDSMI